MSVPPKKIHTGMRRPSPTLEQLALIEVNVRHRFTLMGRGLMVVAVVTGFFLAVLAVRRPHVRGSLPIEPVIRRVDVNRADAAELALLPGVGPTLAQRIVEHRQKRGPFRSIEQLQAISGIGPATLASVKPYVYCSQNSATLPASPTAIVPADQ